MRIYIFILVALVCSNAAAVEWNTKDDIHITKVRAQGQRDLISFNTEEPIYNPGSCGSSDYYAFEVAEEVSNQMLSILLSAAASGKSIGVNVHSGACSWGRPVVVDVWINY